MIAYLQSNDFTSFSKFLWELKLWFKYDFFCKFELLFLVSKFKFSFLVPQFLKIFLLVPFYKKKSQLPQNNLRFFYGEGLKNNIF